MRTQKSINFEKICPMLDKPCLKNGCQIYNNRLDNCEIYVLSYNLFKLSKQLEKEVSQPTE